MSVVDNIVNNSNNQPSEVEEKERQLLEQLLKLRISVDDPIGKDVYMLEIDGTEMFAKGDINALKAKAKSGKTSCICAITAAMLSGKWGPLTCPIENARIIWLDTEQRHDDTVRMYLRTLKMAGLPMKDIYERFQLFPLRSFICDRKMESLRLLIKTFQPDVIFIDGIVDLMVNFNDVEESKKIIEELMRLSTKEESGNDVAIICVLHTNKAAEDHNMRGHLGTMLTQKAGTVLEVSKNKNGLFTVSNTEARHKEAPDWSFCYDQDGNIVDATKMVEEKIEQDKKMREAEKQEKKDAEEQKLIDTIKGIIRKNGGTIEHTALRDEIRKATKRELSTANGYIRKYVQAGIFKQSNDYVFIADEAADEAADSNQLDLPFV